jgi:hypothetical protein
MSCIGSVPFSDREAEQALAANYGAVSLQRSVVDGQKGYTVTHANGVRCFHFRLSTAIPEMLAALGHSEDRDVMVIGEPEQGNAWMVERA